MSVIASSFRYAGRSLARDRSQVAGIVLTLALGIGVVTTMAGLADRVFFRALPFADGDRLVTISNRYGHGSDTMTADSSPPDYKDRLDFSRTVDSLAAWTSINMNLTGRGEPVRILAGRTTASLAPVLGVAAHDGRWFTTAEDEASAHVAVLSAGLATALFGETASALGQELILNGTGFEIVGVMDRSFDFAPAGGDLWVPLGLTAADFSNEERGSEYLNVVGRLSKNATVDQARADMQSIAEGVIARDPSRADFLRAAGWGAIVTPLRDELYGELKDTSKMLFVFGVVVLLLSLTNATQLAVVRTLRKRESLAIREAVGANRRHVVTQLVCEATMMGVVAASIGLAIPGVVFAAVRQLAPSEALRDLPVALDVRVAAVALIAAIACGLLASLGPLVASRGALASMLRAGRAGSQSRGTGSLRGVVTVVEVALSVALIAGGIGVWQRVSGLLETQTGFRSEGITTMRLSLPADSYGSEERLQFQKALLSRLDENPGIESSAIVTSFPMSGESWTMSFDVDGRPDLESAGANIRIASPGYFDLMNITIREGESFSDERDDGRLQVLIDEAAANRYWPGSSPVGKRITFSDEDDEPINWWTVVGVVASVRDESLAAPPEPHVYISSVQRPPRSFFVAVSTAATGRGAESIFRESVKGLDPSLPVWNVSTADQYMRASLAQHRFRVSVLWSFGLAGLVLAAFGVYGVVAFAYSLSRADNAVRLALGATRIDLVRLGIVWVARPLLAGAVIGIAVSLSLTSLVRDTVDASMELSLGACLGASLIVAAVVMIAALVPAMKMSKIDPVEALRST